MHRLVDELPARLRERGYQVRMVSISHLKSLQHEIDDLRNHGLLDSEFYQTRLVRQVMSNLPAGRLGKIAITGEPLSLKGCFLATSSRLASC